MVCGIGTITLTYSLIKNSAHHCVIIMAINSAHSDYAEVVWECLCWKFTPHVL